MRNLHTPLLLLLVAASACAGPSPANDQLDGPVAAEEPPTSPAAADESRPADATLDYSDTDVAGIWAIDPEVFDGDSVEEVEEVDVVGDPVDGEPAGPAATDEGALEPEALTDPPDQDTVVEAMDPCSLITLEEWESMAAAAGRTVVLEAGDACGYLAEGDLVRLAVGVFAWQSGPRWATGLSPVEEVRPGLLWAEAHPVPESSTLILELAAWDVVLEVSARDGRTTDELRTALLPLAEAAAGRLP